MKARRILKIIEANLIFQTKQRTRVLKPGLKLRSAAVSRAGFPVLALPCSLRAEGMLWARVGAGLSEDEGRFCLQLVATQIWVQIRGGGCVFGGIS